MRASMLWAGEAFDDHRKKVDASSRGRRRRSQRRRLSATIPLEALLRFLRGLSLARIEQDLRTCLNAHPWTGDAFVSFLDTYFAVGSAADVEARSPRRFSVGRFALGCALLRVSPPRCPAALCLLRSSASVPCLPASLPPSLPSRGQHRLGLAGASCGRHQTTTLRKVVVVASPF